MITSLKKKLEEVEKAKDQAEQDGYDVGVAETEEALRAKVMGVCRTYCLQVWNEALDQAKVEASSSLRKVENVYYPPPPLSNPCIKPSNFSKFPS